MPIVYIVDDDESVRKAMSRLFRTEGFAVEAFESAEEFLDFQLHDELCCLVLDVDMPSLSGIELQERLSKQRRKLPIVFVTGQGDIPMSVTAMKAGAVDFLPKPVDNEQLLNAVRNAIQNYSLEKSRLEELDQFLDRVDELTERERQVMELVVEGLLNKQVAKRLQISEATVKVHRGRVMEKTGLNSLAELARLCERAKLR